MRLLRLTKDWVPYKPSVHRLRLGLPGYLIPFATLAFAFQCQLLARKSPSPLVFLLIFTDFTPTLEVPFSSPKLKMNSFGCSFRVKPENFTPNLFNHLHALYAQLFRTTFALYVLPRLLARI